MLTPITRTHENGILKLNGMTLGEVIYHFSLRIASHRQRGDENAAGDLVLAVAAIHSLQRPYVIETKEADQACATCRYRTKGECRRYPPQMTLWATDNQHPLTYVPAPTWPYVPDDGWCGEWKEATP
jgi:hypothetical protein